MTCKFCKSEIANDALKCPHCAEWQSAEERAKHERASKTPESQRAKEKSGIEFVSALVAVGMMIFIVWWIARDVSPSDINAIANTLQ